MTNNEAPRYTLEEIAQRLQDQAQAMKRISDEMEGVNPADAKVYRSYYQRFVSAMASVLYLKTEDDSADEDN